MMGVFKRKKKRMDEFVSEFKKARPGLKDNPIQRSRARRMDCQRQLDSPNHVFYENWPEPSDPMLR